MSTQPNAGWPLRHWCVAATAWAVLSATAAAASGPLETLVHFQCATLGCAPNGVFVQAQDGYFYGTTSEGDFVPGEDGTVFRMDRRGAISLLPSSAGAFVAAADGFLYGTTDDGGAFSAGTVFRMDGNGAVLDEYSFDGTHASSPGGLVQANDGSFYGTVVNPATGAVRLFRVGMNFRVTLLRELRLAEPDRNIRMLLAPTKGFLYGTTYSGLVLRMHRNGQTHVLASFSSLYVDIMQAKDGYFYGATLDGGAYGGGTLFRMTRSGKVKVLHSFGKSQTAGSGPFQAPIEGTDGYFYGTTYAGGKYGVGTIYRMDRSGAIRILHSFGEFEHSGANPVGEMVRADDLALYGTTASGGMWGHGTAFRLPLAKRH